MSEPTSNELALSAGDRAVGAPERLHPLFLLSGFGGSLRGVAGGYAALAYLVVSGRFVTAVFVALGMLLVGGVAVFLYWRHFEFRVGASEIRIDSGIFSRTHRSIPFGRIQDVDISQGPLGRLFGIAKVRFETGGSSGPKADEGVLQAIPLERAEELRELIRARRPVRTDAAAAIEEEAEAGPIYRMDLRRLLLAGTFNFSLALFAGLIGLTQTMGDVMGFDPLSRSFWLGVLSAGGPLRDFILANQVATAVSGLVLLVLIGVATGIVRTLVRDWGFRLDRTETGLRRRRGLTTITDVTLRVRRVQAAIAVSGPIRDSLGYSELKLQNLGQGEEGGDHVVAPLATRGELDRIVAEIGWRPLPGAIDWQRVSSAFVWTFLLGLAPLLIIGALAQIAFAPVLGLAWLAVPLLLWFARRMEWRRIGYALDGDRLLIRGGWWKRRITILPLRRIQSTNLNESFISRWFDTASLDLGVAGGNMLARHSIPAIPRGRARELRDQLLGMAS